MKASFLALKFLHLTAIRSQYSLVLFTLIAALTSIASLTLMSYLNIEIIANSIEILSIGAASLLLQSTLFLCFIILYSTLSYFTFMAIGAFHILSFPPLYAIIGLLALSYIVI